MEVDDRNIKGHSQIHQNLATSAGIVKLGLALMEKLTTLLLSEGRDPDSYSASCVVHFRTRIVPDVSKELLARTFQSKLYTALEELVTLIRFHYPGILEKAYIINPSDEYFASLDIPESLLKNTILLQNPQHLADYLGSQIPPEYGDTGKSSIESDFLPSSSFHITPKESGPRDTERLFNCRQSPIDKTAQLPPGWLMPPKVSLFKYKIFKKGSGISKEDKHYSHVHPP